MTIGGICGVIDNQQIQPAIAVVVQKGSGSPPVRFCASQCAGNIFELSFAGIAVQCIPSIVGNEHIRKSVVVHIPDCHASPIARISQTGLRRHIHEASRFVLAKQAIAQIDRRWKVMRGLRRTTAVHEVQVHPAIAVIVQKSGPGANGFRHEPCPQWPDRVCELNSQFVRHILQSFCGDVG